MSHKIEINDRVEGTYKFWHGLNAIEEKMSLEDNWLTKWDLNPVTLQKRGLDTKWSILECSDSPDIEIGAPYNPETFVPITNLDFLNLIRDSLGGTDHELISVGSVRNRGRVFVSFRLKGMEKFKAANRNFSAFLNYGNGHDKSSVLWVNTSSICTECDNRFSYNLHQVENKDAGNQDDIRASMRHTKNAKLRLPEISKLVDKAIGVQAEFQLEMDKLANIKCGNETAEKLFAGFVGRKITDDEKGLSTHAQNQVSELMAAFAKGPGNNGDDMSDAFSAVTQIYTHGRPDSRKDPLKQFVSSEFGSGAANKSEFFRVVTNAGNRIKAIKRGGELLALSLS